MQENASARAATTVQRALCCSLRLRVARLTAIINGASSWQAIAQALIDAMFGR
jgi:hypothetical protein